MTDVNNKVRSLDGEGAETREGARTRLHEFLEELGQALGGDRDALSLIDAKQRFAEMRERVRELFERRADELALSASALDSADTMEFLETLADALEIKDPSMYGHASRVASYASLLAERAGMEPREIEEVRLAAFLHDIGKLGVPTDLLLRPGALDSTERALVGQHAEIGSRLLKPLALPASVSLAACHHHEWWNGSGYPDGLSSEQIPLTARIIGIVDAFDAMTTDRPYSAALPREAAIDELHRFSGVQFDPVLAKEFILVLESDASGSDPEMVADIVADVGQGTKAIRQNSAAAHGSIKMSAFLRELMANEGIPSAEQSAWSEPTPLRTPARRFPRSEEIRIVEVWPFPRERGGQVSQIGFTRDVSELGMCIGVDQAEAVGTLLRVDVRTLDGESMGATIARVAWCSASRAGRHWLGLELLFETDAKPRPEADAA